MGISAVFDYHCILITIEKEDDSVKENITLKNPYRGELILFTIIPKNLASDKSEVQVTSNVKTTFVVDDPNVKDPDLINIT